MIKNRAAIILLIMVSGIGCFYLLKTQPNNRSMVAKRFFTPLAIEGFSSGDIPYCTVHVGNHAIKAKFDLGYEGSLELPSHVLHEVQKKQSPEQRSSYSLHGKPHPIKIYKFQKIAIGNIDFTVEEVAEKSPDLEQELILVKSDAPGMNEAGRIGWQLFKEHNLLIDCKNDQFVLCNNLEILKKEGYPVDTFTETSFILDHGFIEFAATTDMGPLWCILDTGSTWNMYNQNNEPSHMGKSLFDPKDTFDTGVFQIGHKNFGPITFNRIYSPVPLQAIIGMEFFRDTMVYIDFKNQKLYFYEYPRP